MVRSNTAGFTLVEILIVVIILGILGMIVVPKYSSATAEAREATIASNLQSVQMQIDRYTVDHTGRGPQLDSSGAIDADNFAGRLTQRTDIHGLLDANGTLGPYMPEMPANPFAAEAKLASLVKVGQGIAPRDETSGWFFDAVSRKISPNSAAGALADFPPKPVKSSRGIVTRVAPAPVLR